MIANTMAGASVGFALGGGTTPPPSPSPFSQMGAKGAPPAYAAMGRAKPGGMTTAVSTARYGSTSVSKVATPSRTTAVVNASTDPGFFARNRSDPWGGSASSPSPVAATPEPQPITPVVTPNQLPSVSLGDKPLIPGLNVAEPMSAERASAAPMGVERADHSEFAVKFPTWTVVAGVLLVGGLGAFALSRVLPKR